MNRSQTALQSRSSAIRTALDKYNAAARALSPPRRQLKWDKVVEYAFLADFDLLRDTRQDISTRPWVTPAGRLAMDHHFKILRACEEILRLNVEIRRVATYLVDEDRYLRTCETQRGRFNARHVQRLHAITELPGFTGTITPGVSLLTSAGESASKPNLQPPMVVDNFEPTTAQLAAFSFATSSEDTQQELDEDDEEDDSVDEVSRALKLVLRVSADTSHACNLVKLFPVVVETPQCSNVGKSSTT
ncbi:hypothetical protein HWV62_35588, partial [Athelia sp. TMB]